MKRILIITTIIITSILLISCSKNLEFEEYNNDTFGYIDIKKDEVKLLQITDLHLTYGFDYLDRKTFNLIDSLVEKEKPDIIVVTGDIMMSIISQKVLKKFIKQMDKYNIPWTFVFGNHEADYQKIEKSLNTILKTKTKNLYFHKGPTLSNNNTHGNSNFILKITNNNKPILNLYLLDSKANRTDGVKDDRFPYDYVSNEQVSWYRENVQKDIVESLLFVHIPLIEYLEYDGNDLGELIWPQGKNTGLFQTILDTNAKTRGVFVGHDHLNNTMFYYEGILLAYGNTTGYNAYGINPKGARTIIYNYNTKELNTYLVLDSEV